MTRKLPARPILDQHVTINEIATRFNLSPWTVRAWIQDGKLAAVKVGNGPRAPLRIRVADVEALLNPVTPSGRRSNEVAKPEADDPAEKGVHGMGTLGEPPLPEPAR